MNNLMDNHYIKFSTLTGITGMSSLATMQWNVMFSMTAAFVSILVGIFTIRHLIRQNLKAKLEIEIIKRNMCKDCQGQDFKCSILGGDFTQCKYSEYYSPNIKKDLKKEIQ